MDKSIFVIFVVLVIITSAYIAIYSYYYPQAFFSAPIQKAFILDMDSPLFMYEENYFNDLATTQEYDYSAAGDVTYWVEIPKNSTILNATMNVTGKIVPAYSVTISSTYGLMGISIGNITTHSGNEIVTGTQVSEEVIRVLYGNNGSLIWNYTLPSPNNAVFSTSVGNVTTNPGNEIVIGSQDNYVYVLNVQDSGGSQAWNYSTTSDVVSVVVGDLDDDGINEVVAGSDDVYALNSTGQKIWNYSISGNDVAIGNISTDSGNEVIVGASGGVYAINSTGNFIWSNNLGGIEIKSVSVGNVTSDPGNEIAIGGADNKVYLLNSTGQKIWNYTTNGEVNTVIIGDVVTPSGNEVIAGSNDKKIYTLNSSGSLIWDYTADDYVTSVTVENVTVDVGNEVIAGTRVGSGMLYVFNFDYFPTNLALDVGANTTFDWNSSYSKLRNTETVSGITSTVQYYLDTCTADANGKCDVPFLFYSAGPGRLNISSLNVTYNYNITSLFLLKTVSAWSRISNINVNESVGNQTKNITFVTNPANDINVSYVRIDDSATRCDFNLTAYTENYTINGKNVCNVTDFIVPASGPLPGSVLFWDDSMPTGIPITINESLTYNTTGIDNYYLKKNLTIRNETNETFYNVTANTSVNYADIHGQAFLNVSWGGSWYNITPNSSASNCNTANPTYTTKTAGSDIFYVCMQDTNTDNIIDFFKWKQPYSNSSVNYQTGGSTNLLPNLTNESVTPLTDIWNNTFNFSIFINDTEGDEVNITLWIFINKTDNWVINETKTVYGNGTVWFNVTSNKSWTGINKYKFEFFDFNSSNTSQKFHSPQNTSEFTGPTGLKHATDVFYIAGNNSEVNRSESVLLIVRVNDTNTSEFVNESVSCTFWVTTDGSNFDSGHQNMTNSSGYCQYSFTPDENYSAGNQTWKAGVYQDSYYSDSNSSNFILPIKGKLNISLTKPSFNQSVVRNTSMQIEAQIIDEYSVGVNDTTINTSNYNCTFYFNNTNIGTGNMNISGFCNLTFTPNCTYTDLGSYVVNVTLNGPEPTNYTIINNQSNTSIVLFDNLNITIYKPQINEMFNKGENLTLNSTVNDTCLLCSQGDYNVIWYLKWKQKLSIFINETQGVDRINEPVIINGSELASLIINLSDWRINYTKVLLNGIEVPSEVKAWTNESKTEINTTQVYLNNYSELVFLINLTANQNANYWVYYNESDDSDYNLSYLLNSGFEGNNLNDWTCINTSCTGTYCVCNTTSEGSEENGSYSAYISAEADPPNNIIGIQQSIPTGINSTYIKTKYKPTGEFNISGGAYLRLEAGGGLCELNTTQDIWHEDVCENASFYNATSINITVHDVGDGGSLQAASRVYIDYVCISNAVDCITLHSGALQQKEIDSDKVIGNEDNTTWTIPVNESLGTRIVVANASGTYYNSDKENISILLYGWSMVSDLNVSSVYCIHDEENQTTKCKQNSSISAICYVIDANTSAGIGDYNVSFFNHINDFIGSNLTNSTGFALLNFTTPDTTGKFNVSCNITDQPSIFYNITSNNNKTAYYNITLGNTTGELLQTPRNVTASSINKTNNYNFSINLTLINTGNGTMYNPVVNITTPAGIYASDVSCSPVGLGSNCTTTSDINVTYEADAGYANITVNITWDNDDPFQGSVQNYTTLFIENNTVLFVNKTEMNYTIPVGGSNTTENFIVDAFGNTELLNVSLNMSGGNASILSEWITYSNKSFNVSKSGNKTVTINLTVPENATEGLYSTNIIINATESVCSPANKCWDTLTLNVNVTQQDWSRTPSSISKTIGLKGNGTIGVITVTNNKEFNYSFTVSVTGNGSVYITTDKTSLDVNADSSKQVTVYHNASPDYQYGSWFANVTITSLNSTTPTELNTSVTLNVINLTIDILSPNQTSQAGPVNANDLVSITVNATLNFAPIDDNMTWEVAIGGETCGNVNSSYNASGYWSLNCTAPMIPDNPINNTLRVTGNYTTQGLSVYDEETNAVTYYDITPPKFFGVDVTSVDYNENASYILISVNITDNTAVNASYAVVTYDSTTVSMDANNYTVSGDIYTYNFSNPNTITDYDITIYANDSQNQTNYTTGWFEVYLNIQFYGNNTDALGNNVSSDFTFYRPRTGDIIHSFSVNSTNKEYNFTVHKRNYDLEVKVFNHTIKFNDVNITLSAINQWNSTTPENITNPIYFDDVDISAVYLQDTTQHKLLAMAIKTIISYDDVNLVLNYSQYLDLHHDLSEPALHVYKCSSWDFYNRTGCDGNWEDVGGSPNSLNHIISLNTSSASAFTVAEYCPTCPGGDGDGIPPTDGGGGISDGGDEDESVCGNGKCETGENELNCPSDCLLEEKYPFTIKTSIGDIRIRPGDNATYPFSIKNKLSSKITAIVSVSGEIESYIMLEKSVVDIEGNDTESFNVYVSVPPATSPGTYTGVISVTAEGKTQVIPVTMRVSLAGEADLSLMVDLITKTVTPDGNLKFSVELRNIGFRMSFNVTLTYYIKTGETEEIVKKENETVFLETGKSFTKTISLKDVETPLGNYYLEVWADFDSKSVKDIETFEVVQSFWETPTVFYSVIAVIIIVAGVAIYFGMKRYKKWKKAKARYVFPVNYRKIPQKTDISFWLGRIAETSKDTWFNPNDLTTHALVAGSTGSGKSVGASIFVEEALDKKIPVIAFDPTAQWTGFVKQCKDENLLKYYGKFGMDKRNVRSYKGMIFEVIDPNVKIDFKKFMNPGEITVFTLDKLKPGQYDEAVQNIINAIFRVGWEESTTLKMIIVFDEVHRLLEKYGGKGGYIALEKACREFRKWGIGLIMCSQVLADFKEAIAGNVLTDVQLNTKSITDIKKVEEKYGLEYARRISRQAVGVGMFQNPKYNDGKPYFVNFRPTYHNPHKITNEEMQIYKEFAKRLEVIENKISEMKKKGIDTFDIELELKLAKDKLKLGRFRMAKIYTTSLEQHFNIKTEKKG